MSEEINDRLERIGSSMIYDIVSNGGQEAYEKLALKIPTIVNDYMERGLRFELPVMQWAADDNGWTFTKAETVRWEEDGVPYRDTPDFWIESNGKKILAEVKTHNQWIREQYGAEYSEDVPDRVFCQAQFHCAANDVDECRVIPSFGGEKPEVFFVYRDRAVWKNIHKACVAFWHDHVLTKIPPPPVEASKYPRLRDENMLVATEEHLAKHNRRDEVIGMISGLKAEKDEIDEWFKIAIGENVGIQNDALRYTWKAGKAKQVIDYKGLIHEMNPDPELLAKYTKTVEGNRILRSVKPKVTK